jgi:flagellar motor switch protein FliN/FliY
MSDDVKNDPLITATEQHNTLDNLINNVEHTSLENLVAEQNPNTDVHPNMDVIMEIPVVISMEVGKTEISIRNLLKLSQGSVVELDRYAGDPLDVYVNGTLIAHGEVVVVNEKFGIRLTDVISTAERIKKLGDL